MNPEELAHAAHVLAPEAGGGASAKTAPAHVWISAETKHKTVTNQTVIQSSELTSKDSQALAFETLIEASVHPPNEFLDANRAQLLPDWSDPIASVVVVLQQCPIPLLEKTPVTEIEKLRLRQRFLELGQTIVQHLQHLGFACELFDPQNGHPLLSRSGSLQLDDLAVIRAVLGYPSVPQGECLVMEHPRWGKAVYPSILVSTAPPEVVQELLKTLNP